MPRRRNSKKDLSYIDLGFDYEFQGRFSEAEQSFKKSLELILKLILRMRN